MSNALYTIAKEELEEAFELDINYNPKRILVMTLNCGVHVYERCPIVKNPGWEEAIKDIFHEKKAVIRVKNYTVACNDFFTHTSQVRNVIYNIYISVTPVARNLEVSTSTVFGDYLLSCGPRNSLFPVAVIGPLYIYRI